MCLTFLILFLFSVAQAAKQGAQISVPDETKLVSFRWGQTLGCCPGSAWNDATLTDLSAKGASETQRKKLPESHLERWGYGIELDDSQRCLDDGVVDLVGYLCIPTSAHSSYSSNAENYPPLNLYEPIWLPSGGVNPENYWASYVNKTVSTYKKFVKIWEVWNEPDYTGNWNAVETWLTVPPNSQDLSHWHGTIFEYIRLLRITYEVTKKIDPEAWVATGGIGYYQFLDAILRYTDEPTNGTITNEYPVTGGAWFDCCSFHLYPHYGVYDLENKVWLNDIGSDAMAEKFIGEKRSLQYELSKYGYNGLIYPKKMFIATETGVSSISLNSLAGSETLRRNYIAKLPLLSIANGIKQAHWFMLYDGSGSSIYEKMGDFYITDGSSVNGYIMKNSTKAKLTFQDLEIGKMTYSSSETATLRSSLPVNVTGIVLGNSSVSIWAIWRLCQFTEIEEHVSVSITLPMSCYHISWYGEKSRLNSGVNSLKITGSPTYFLIYQGIPSPGGQSTNDNTSETFSTSPIKIIVLLLAIFSLF